jgi:hypothetical protein
MPAIQSLTEKLTEHGERMEVMKTKRFFSVLFVICVFGFAAIGYVSEGLCDTNQAFTVVKLWSGPDINVKSIASGKIYNVQYTGSIEPEIDDTVTIIIDDNDNWKTIINHRTGKSSAITSVKRL